MHAWGKYRYKVKAMHCVDVVKNSEENSDRVILKIDQNTEIEEKKESKNYHIYTKMTHEKISVS